MSKITAVISLTTCLIGFGFGYVVCETQQNDKLVNRPASHTNEKQSTTAEASTPNNRQSNNRTLRYKKSHRNSPKNQKRSTRQIVTDMKNSLGSNSKMMNIRGLFSAWNSLDGLSESQLSNILSEVTPENFRDQSNMSMFMLVTTRLAEMNPAKAMALIQDGGNLVKGIGEMSVMESWSESDPVAAYEWYKKEKQAGNLKNGMFGGSDQLISQVFAGLAAQNPESAFSEFDKLDKKESVRAIRGIALNLQTKDEFVDMINRISDDKGKAKKALIGTWLQKDPMVAADWTYENADDKQKALKQIVSGISGFGENLEVAAEWLQKEDRGNVDKQWRRLIRSSSYMDPKAAADLVANIQDKKMREKALSDVIQTWRRRDKQAAEKYIKEADLTDEMRNKLNKESVEEEEISIEEVF